ncbi:unnamed protein product [Pleuronectes platessa]|uniref:Uncharacterized protein n=1 Tax=Pleuronectes platessa TaxID=8262 RepID=A0A9N7YYX9_PLEPL|nr:unnamed protein product [Pleuronectes platessa]
MDRRFVSWLGINEDGVVTRGNRLGGGPGGIEEETRERKQMHMRRLRQKKYSTNTQSYLDLGAVEKNVIGSEKRRNRYHVGLAPATSQSDVPLLLPLVYHSS